MPVGLATRAREYGCFIETLRDDSHVRFWVSTRLVTSQVALCIVLVDYLFNFLERFSIKCSRMPVPLSLSLFLPLFVPASPHSLGPSNRLAMNSLLPWSAETDHQQEPVPASQLTISRVNLFEREARQNFILLPRCPLHTASTLVSNYVSSLQSQRGIEPVFWSFSHPRMSDLAVEQKFDVVVFFLFHPCFPPTSTRPVSKCESQPV